MNRLDEVIERVSKTSKGEWHYNTSSCVLTMGQINDMELGSGKYCIIAPFIQFSMDKIDNDFEFLANSKKDVEYLIDEVARLRRIDEINLKPKEEIINKINRYEGEILTIRMQIDKEGDYLKRQLLYDQEIELKSKIESLYWVLEDK